MMRDVVKDFVDTSAALLRGDYLNEYVGMLVLIATQEDIELTKAERDWPIFINKFFQRYRIENVQLVPGDDARIMQLDDLADKINELLASEVLDLKK